MARPGGNPDIGKLGPKPGEVRNPYGVKGKPRPSWTEMTPEERDAEIERRLGTVAQRTIKQTAAEYDRLMRPAALASTEIMFKAIELAQKEGEDALPASSKVQLINTVLSTAAKFRELAEDKGPNLNVNFNLPPAREIATMLFGEHPPVLDVQGERLPALEQFAPLQASAGEAIEVAVSLTPHGRKP